MKKAILIPVILAALLLTVETASARRVFVPPASFQRVVIEPFEFTTNQMDVFRVRVLVVPISNGTIDKVEVGLANASGQMQAIRFVSNLPAMNVYLEVLSASNFIGSQAAVPAGVWEGIISLPHEDLENGVFLVNAYLATNEYYPKSLKASTNFNVFPDYNPNARRSTRWAVVMDVVFLGALLMIANFLRRKLKFFQKFLVPPSMIAGFLGIIVGPNVLNLVQFSPDRLGNLVYHLMAVGFIALSLMRPERDEKKVKNEFQPVNTGAIIVGYYLMQGIIGFGVTLILAYTIFPNLFPPFGMLLPLGFGQGPGIAYTMGSSWEKSGFLYGGNIGLTIATFGFIWACFIGVPLMNVLLRRGKMKPASTVYGKSAVEESQMTQDLMKDRKGDIPLSDSIDRLTIQAFLIAIVYLVTYAFLFGFEKLMDAISTAAPGFTTIANTFSNMFWGFFFIFGSIFAAILRKSFKWFKNNKWMSRNYPNDYLLQRISSGSFDFLVTASIAAISIPVFLDNAVTILIVTSVGGFATLFYTIFVCKWVYKKYTLEYTLALFGMGTGTLSTGVALLKEVDPTFETPAAKDMVYGSGTAVGFGFPMMMLLAVPVIGYVEQKPGLYGWTMLLMLLMMGLLFLLVFFNKRVRALKEAKLIAAAPKGGSGQKKKK